jgi:hypothetical protein
VSEDSDTDDIPFIANTSDPQGPADPPDPPRAAASTVPNLPRQPDLAFFRVSYTTGTLSSTKKEIYFFDNFDGLLFSAIPREMPGNDSYVILDSTGLHPPARVEVAKKESHYTLMVTSPDCEKEVVGVAWESRPYGALVRVALMPNNRQYVSTDPRTRLGALAASQALPDGCWAFTSKPPPGESKRTKFTEVPQLADQSDKCFVIVDQQGLVLFKIYKMADKFYTVQAATIFDPMAAFGCTIGILIK